MLQCFRYLKGHSREILFRSVKIPIAFPRNTFAFFQNTTAFYRNSHFISILFQENGIIFRKNAILLRGNAIVFRGNTIIFHQLLAVGWWFPPGTPISSTRKLISSSFHRLEMTLAVAEALTPNKPNQTNNIYIS